MSLILTRLLYPKDEVIASLVTELIAQQNIHVCYYWFSELYYSDQNIFSLIWKIYFDFYAEYNPKLVIYIKKRYLLWKTDYNIQYLFDIIYNLFICNSSSTVFMLRQYCMIHNKPLIIYKKNSHKKWDWLKKYKKCFYTFLRAIYKDNLICAASELQLLVSILDAKEIYNVIISYYSTRIELVSSKMIDKKWESREWYDDFHGLLSLLVHLHTDPDNVKKCHVFKTSANTDIKEYIDMNNSIEDRHDKKDKVYKIMAEFRLYKLHDGCNAFKVAKTDMLHFKLSNLNHWEYYAAASPLWKSRINMCSGTICDKTKTILFENEYDMNLFYDSYHMEFDEQSKETQDMSLCNKKEITWKIWHSNIFDTEPIIQFTEQHCFSY